MSKAIGKLRLAPYVPSWYDMINEIHLVRPHRTSYEVKEGADLEPIMRGVQAGYVIFNEIVEEVKEEIKTLEPQKIELDMQAPETPVAKKKRKSKKKVEEDKVDSPAGGEIESPKEEDGEF